MLAAVGNVSIDSMSNQMEVLTSVEDDVKIVFELFGYVGLISSCGKILCWWLI